MLKRLRRVLLVAIVPVLLTWATPASAFHTPEQRLYDETAYTLEQGELSLGLRRLSIGVFDRLTLGTQPLIWFVGLPAGTFVPNVEARIGLYDGDAWALSVGGGFFFGRVTPRDDVAASFNGILAPVSATASVRWDETWTTSLTAAYTFARVTAGTPPSESGDLQGGAVVSSFQMFSTLEMRQSRVLSLTFTGRFAPYFATIPLTGTVTLDGLTTATVDARVEIKALRYAAAFEVAAVWSWNVFNLKLGLGYGSLFLPGTGLVVPGTYPIPVLELFWRF